MVYLAIFFFSRAEIFLYSPTQNINLKPLQLTCRFSISKLFLRLTTLIGGYKPLRQSLEIHHKVSLWYGKQKPAKSKLMVMGINVSEIHEYTTCKRCMINIGSEEIVAKFQFLSLIFRKELIEIFRLKPEQGEKTKDSVYFDGETTADDEKRLYKLTQWFARLVTDIMYPPTVLHYSISIR